MFVVSKLSVKYIGQDFLFSNVSFTLDRGQSLWLKGANGTGKTTLLYALCNVIPQAIDAERTGEIRLDGVLLNDIPLQKLLPDLSLMLCNPAWELFFTYPEDEIVFALENMGLPDIETNQRLKSVCSEFALTEWLSTPAHKLSAGWQKMVVLAAHAAVKPKVLLLDEPFNGLSDANAERVLNWLKKYVKEGGMLMIAEHSPLMEQLDPILLDFGTQPCQ